MDRYNEVAQLDRYYRASVLVVTSVSSY